MHVFFVDNGGQQSSVSGKQLIAFEINETKHAIANL